MEKPKSNKKFLSRGKFWVEVFYFRADYLKEDCANY